MWILFLLCCWLDCWSCPPPRPPYLLFLLSGGLRGQRLGACTLILSGASRSFSLKFDYFSSYLCLCVCVRAWSSDTVGSVGSWSAFCSRRPEIHSCNLWHSAGVKTPLECKDEGRLDVVFSLQQETQSWNSWKHLFRLFINVLGVSWNACKFAATGSLPGGGIDSE